MTHDPYADRVQLSISGTECDIVVSISSVSGLTSYSFPLDLGVLGKHRVMLDLFHPDEPIERRRRTPLHPNEAELQRARHAIAGLVGLVAQGREQPGREVLDVIATEALRSSGWEPPGWGSRAQPPPIPIDIKREPPEKSWVSTEGAGRIRRWLIARRLGLRCLVCNRRAGYGGRCPNPEHNA